MNKITLDLFFIDIIRLFLYQRQLKEFLANRQLFSHRDETAYLTIVLKKF